MKSVFVALMLLVFSGATLAQSNYAPDYAEAFAPTAHVQVAELSAQEMDETEGEALWIGAVLGGAAGGLNAWSQGATGKQILFATATGALGGFCGGVAASRAFSVVMRYHAVRGFFVSNYASSRHKEVPLVSSR